MHDYVVWGVERSGVVVVDQGGCLVRAFGFHVDQSTGFFQRPLRTNDQPVAEIGAPIRHVVPFWTSDFITGKICRGEELDFSDDDCFVMCRDCIRGGVWYLIGSDEEGV